MNYQYEHILKIKVHRSGDLFIDNKSVSWKEFENSLSKLKEIKGAVWFYRENAIGVPNEIAEQVFTKILQMKLPISLSSKEDFSDSIDENGESIPRV